MRAVSRKAGEGASGQPEEERRRNMLVITSLVRYPRDGDAEAVRSWRELLRALKRVEATSGRQIDLFVGGTALKLDLADASSVASALLERPERYVGRLTDGGASVGASVGRLRAVLLGAARPRE